MSLPRRVALVTGAAQGLGKAIALRLAKDGHHVGLNDLPSKKAVLEDVAHQVEQHGMRAGVFTGDVTKENDVRATIDGAADALGGLHLMVANAGILLPAPFLEETLQSFNRVTSVSSTGTFLCYQHAGRRMIKEGHGEGRIIGASSYGGKRPLPGLTSYVAAKLRDLLAGSSYTGEPSARSDVQAVDQKLSPDVDRRSPWSILIPYAKS